MSSAPAFYQRQRWINGFAIIASLSMSFYMAYRADLINPDAICYLLSAAFFDNGTLSAVMQLCGQAKWPFYSLLIHGLVRISWLSYVNAAYVLDALFSLLSVITFLLIVTELAGGKATPRLRWCAVFVILCAHEFNSVREYIIRDHGFWAFYLLSVYFLLRYFQQPRKLVAIAFSSTLLLATLFRVEGMLFLLALPFLTWFDQRYSVKQRSQHFFMLSLPTIIIAMLMLSWLLLHPERSLAQFGRLIEFKNQLLYGVQLIALRYQTAKAAMAHYILTTDAARDAGAVLGMVFVVWYVFSLLVNLSLIYAALLFYAVWRHLPRYTHHGVLTGYLLVNVVVTLGFLAEHLFLSNRYLLGLSLILMLWVPFALDDLLARASSTRYRLLAGFAILFMAIATVGSLVNFGYSKAYVRVAGEWLNSHVPKEASLYANDPLLMYYSKHFGNDLFAAKERYARVDQLQAAQLRHYDYLALRFNKHDGDKRQQALQALPLIPVRIFQNKRGDSVFIFQVNGQRQEKIP